MRQIYKVLHKPLSDHVILVALITIPIFNLAYRDVGSDYNINASRTQSTASSVITEMQSL